MLKRIFDAGPLITACKFGVAGKLVIDYILDHCRIMIAESVRNEVIVAGARFTDAKAAKDRIESGKIMVLSPSVNTKLATLIEPYNLGQGEQDSILMASQSDMQDAIFVVDDHLAYLVTARLGQPRQFLLDTIVQLVYDDNLDRSTAMQIVKEIQTRYPVAFVNHTLLLLQR
jgi:hypothetical protein